MNPQTRPRCISSVTDLKEFKASSLPERIEPRDILMCRPDFFDVVDTKNPFMQGNVGKVDRSVAQAQWHHLVKIYKSIGLTVHELEPIPGLVDMVFCANQCLPFQLPSGQQCVLLGRMKHPERQKEVPFFKRWFEANQYRVFELPEPSGDARFEGQGDAIWHPGRNLIWGGHGFRTEASVYEHVAAITGATVIKLELAQEKFYHLDTCFLPLDENSVLIYRPAFTAGAIELVRSQFADVVEISETDASNFALNAVVAGREVIIEKGSGQTCAELEKRGFKVHEVETSEFMKSGGSVFCLKMFVY